MLKAPRASCQAMVCIGLAILAATTLALGVGAGRIRDDPYYLNAAHFILNGYLPYRDFFFPQAPVSAYFYTLAWSLPPLSPLLVGRLLSAAATLAAIVCAAVLARRWAGDLAAALAAAAVLLTLGTVKSLTEIHALPVAGFFLATGAALSITGRRPAHWVLAGALIGLAGASRVTVLPGLLLAWLATYRLPTLFPRRGWLLLGGSCTLVGIFLPLWLAAGDRLTWAVFLVHSGRYAPMGPLAILQGKFTILLSWAHMHFPAVLGLAYFWPLRRQLAGDKPREEMSWILALVAGVALAHWVAAGPLLTYNCFLVPLAYAVAAALYALAASRTPGRRALGVLTRRRALILLYGVLLATGCLRLVNRYQFGSSGPFARWREEARWWRRHLPADAQPFTLYTSLASAGLLPDRSCAAGHFSYFPEFSEARARHLRVASAARVRRAFQRREYEWVVLPASARCFVFDASINDDREELLPEAQALLRLARSRYTTIRDDGERLVLRREKAPDGHSSSSVSLTE